MSWNHTPYEDSPEVKAHIEGRRLLAERVAAGEPAVLKFGQGVETPHGPGIFIGYWPELWYVAFESYHGGGSLVRTYSRHELVPKEDRGL